MKNRKILLLLMFAFYAGISYGQTLDEARKLYQEGRYAEALPAFEKAVKGSPRNGSYNQWYGHSLLELGRQQEAESYLKTAATRKVTEAYRSLGKLYYQQYRFEESAAAYDEYIAQLEAGKKTEEATRYQPLLEQARRAARMLSRCEDVQIIDSLIVDKNDFLSAYMISPEAGVLEQDRQAVIYTNALGDKRYYGEQKTDGVWRLFTDSKLADGWGDKKELPLPADSIDHQNFPFVMPDGVTVYYASTGNGSIGGYDIFLTRYNMNTDSYLAPNQMGMPFNSIDNDYMMVVDEMNNIGYFATDRGQDEGRVVIYTFIPNESFTAIEDVEEEPDRLVARAKITAIRDSWKSDEAFYRSYIDEAHQNILRELQQSDRDFVFVINDQIVYYSLDDFETEAARQDFLKIKETEQQLQTLEEELDEQRFQYAGASGTVRKRIQSSILEKERRVERLTVQIEASKKALRNREIRSIRSTNK